MSRTVTFSFHRQIIDDGRVCARCDAPAIAHVSEVGPVCSEHMGVLLDETFKSIGDSK